MMLAPFPHGLQLLSGAARQWVVLQKRNSLLWGAVSICDVGLAGDTAVSFKAPDTWLPYRALRTLCSRHSQRVHAGCSEPMGLPLLTELESVN